MKLQKKLETILKEKLEPTELIIINESEKHRGHLTNTNKESNSPETHFSIKIKSKKFENLSLVAQHRLVYDLIGEEFKNTLHALRLDTSST